MQRIARFEFVSKERFVHDWIDTFGGAEESAEAVYRNLKKPKRATSGSAGYDFYAPMDITCKLQRFTIDELRASLNELAISRATVYNTLSLLEDAQLVRRLTKEYGVRAAQYELVRATDSVVQIICQRCGRVGIVKDPTIKRMLADKRWSNFEPDHFSLYVVGQCKVCRRRSNKKS